MLKKVALQRRKDHYCVVHRIFTIRKMDLRYDYPKSYKTYLSMKKHIFFISIGVWLLTTNCSEVQENNDPILGVWSIEASIDSEISGKQTERREWIFNDAFLGRYHTFQNRTINVITDFGWSEENGIYTITYPGTNFPSDIVTLQRTTDGTILQDASGSIFAVKE